MGLSYSLGSLLSIRDVMYCVDALGESPPDTIWIPETWGVEGFAMLAAVSQRTRSKIGSSIINIYSRSPALISMGAVTVDTLSGGRLVLGLGAGSRPIVEDLHGYAFERPVQRMREYVGIIRDATAGREISHNGEIFKLGGFSLRARPARERIPIYLAAVNQKMVELAWELGDGVIFYLRPPGEMRHTISRMQAKRRIGTACQIITAVSEDAEAALRRAKSTIAFYVSVGSIYRKFLAANGYAGQTQKILGAFRGQGQEAAAEAVPDAMAGDLAIHGTPAECRERLCRFTDAGIDMPIIQFNPVGDDVAESFRTVRDAFAGVM